MRAKLDKLVLEEKVPVIGICVGMQMLAVLLVFLFPQLALWLPKTIGW